MLNILLILPLSHIIPTFKTLLQVISVLSPATLSQHLKRCCKSYLSVCFLTASSWAGRANLHVLLLAGSRRLFSLLFIGDPADLWLVEKTSLEPSCNTQPDGIKYPPLALICPQIEIDGRGPTGYLSPHPRPPPLSPCGAF